MSDMHQPPDDEELRRRLREALDSVYRPAPGLRRRAAEAATRGRRRPRLPAPVAWAALSLLAAAAVVVTLVQHAAHHGTPGPVATAAPTATARQSLYAMTAADQVVALDRATLAVRWRAQVAGAPSASVGPGAMMALSRDRRILYVLPPVDAGGGNTVVAVDTADGHVLGSVALSSPGGASYHTLAVDPQSGDVDAVGQDAGHLLVTVVDPQRKLVLATMVTRTLPTARAFGGDYPYQASFTPDGSRLYYSYTGPDADRTGIDWVGVAGTRLTPCRSQAGAACLPGPGLQFVLDGAGLAFGDASPVPQVVTATLDGSVVHRSATGLSGSGTAVGPVLDSTGTRLLAVGDCSSLGGLSSVDRASGRVAAVTTPAPVGVVPAADTVCGQRATSLGGAIIAVSRLPTSKALPQSPGEVDEIDINSGRIIRTTSLPADVADLVAVR